MNQFAKKGFLVGFLTTAMAFTAVAAQSDSTDVKVLVSSAGSYQLSITPSQADGLGSANYVMRHKGKTVWAGTRPFYLRSAVVGNTGAVIGYSMPAGLTQSQAQPIQDQLLIWQINPQGKEKKLKSYDRHPSATGGTSTPICTGVMSYDAENVVLIGIRTLPARRIQAEADTTFLFYNISTGEAKGSWNAARPRADSTLVAYAPIRGSRYTVLGWQGVHGDLMLTVANPQGTYIWFKKLSTSWPNAAPTQLARNLFASRARFSHFVVNVNDRQIEYALNEDTRVVSERMSGPYDALAAERQWHRSIPAARLVFMKGTSLRPKKATAPEPIHDVKKFINAGANRFAYIENWAGSAGHFVLVNTSGNILGRYDLSQLTIEERPTWSDYVWLEDKSFLLALKQGDKPAVLRKINLDDGKFKKVMLSDYDWVAPKFARFADGDIAVTECAPERAEYAHVSVFTPNGTLVNICEIPKDVNDGFRPSGIAVSDNDVICVLDSTNKTVRTFSRNGRYLTLIKLVDSDRHQVDYPTDIAGIKDGFIVQEQLSPKTLRGSKMHFYALSGKLNRTIQPHRSGGGVLSTPNVARLDSANNMWVSNQHALVRLNAQGEVKQVLGPKYDPDTLSEVRNALISPSDFMYVLDGRTMSLHAFTSVGEERYVYKPIRAEFPNGAVSDLSISRDGRVFLGSSSKGDVTLDGFGTFLGYWGTELGTDSFRKTFDASDSNRWVFDTADNSVTLADAQGRQIKSISKRMDGGFLGRALDLRAALDGSACIASRAQDAEGSARTMLNFFDSKGNAASAFMLPKWPTLRLYSYDGNQVILQGNHLLVAYNKRGNALWRSSISPVPDHGMQIVSRDGRYFVTVDPQRASFFALPGTDIYPLPRTRTQSTSPTTAPRRPRKGPVNAVGIG